MTTLPDNGTAFDDEDQAVVGDHELLRLAQLLKLCGDLARSIADTRGADGAQIHALSSQTSQIALKLEALILQSTAVRGDEQDTLDRRH